MLLKLLVHICWDVANPRACCVGLLDFFGPAAQALCVLLPLENLLWAKLRDYAISRVNPNPRQAFLMRVVKM